MSVIFHSTNGNDIQKAMPGDKLCLYLLVNEELKFNPTFTVNGVEYKVNQTEVTNVGNYKYAVVYDIPSDTQDGEMTFEISNIVDLAGNSIDTLTNEDAIEGKSTIDYDSTLPEISVLGITGFFNEAEDADPHYIKTGEKVRILAYYNEKLSVSPIVKIGDKEFQAFYTEDSSDVENNLYAYYADIEITDDLNLADGKIMFSIYGYKDLVGNEDKTYTNEDITYGEDEFSYVILDNVAPSFNVASSTHDEKAMNIVITEDNFDYAVIINQDTGEEKTTSDKEFTISDEATYHIYAYDKSENVSELWVAIDKEKPLVTVSGTGENNKFTSDVVVDASDKFLTEVKINDTIYTRDDFSFDSRNENGKFSIRLTEEKKYTVVAKDKFGHDNKVEFSIDRSAPIVTLKDGDMNVEINTEFVDPGYTVTDNLDKDLEINTIVYYSKDGVDGTWTDAKDNKVDTTVVGHYAIWYSATDSSGNTSDSVRRFVVVQDTIKPIVTLKGTDMTVEVNTEFTDPGVTITDNSGEELTTNTKVYYSKTGADGSWTDAKDNKVDTTVLGHYAIWYSATDSSGNVSDSVRRIVVVQDTIKPIVTLNGTDMTVEGNSEFTDPGVIVTDNSGEELTADITVYYSKNGADGTWVGAPDNKVDTTVVGHYAIWYSATDSSGNVSDSVRRIVVVQDTTAPEIILPDGVIGLNKNEKHIEAGSALSLEGLVQAKDNLDENVKLELKYVTFYAPSGLKEDNIYDYDFSNGIDTKKVGRYNLDYVATDAAGNVAKKTLLIMISDTTKPVISIDRTVELNVGDDFVEDIYSKISDNSDDTLKVEIYPVNGKEVDTTQAGTYQINYKISDTSGNYEVATRTVIVK